MASEKGQEFIAKYKDTDCLKSIWEVVYKKGHITLDEFTEYANLTEEEKAKHEQIDILPTKTLEEQIAEIYQKINANTQANESLAQYVSDLEIQLYEGGAL